MRTTQRAFPKQFVCAGREPIQHPYRQRLPAKAEGLACSSRRAELPPGLELIPWLDPTKRP